MLILENLFSNFLLKTVTSSLLSDFICPPIPIFFCFAQFVTAVVVGMGQRAAVLYWLDLAFSLLYVGPVTVLYWRGTFNILNTLAFQGLSPEDCVFPAVALYLAGLGGKVGLDLGRHYLPASILQWEGITARATATLATYLDAGAGVALWAGGFQLLTSLVTLAWPPLVVTAVVSLAGLAGLRVMHGTAGAPLTVLQDSPAAVFSAVGLGGGLDREAGPAALVLDTLATYCVHSLVVAAWWAVWMLENTVILYPCEITVKDIQAWDSVVIAYFLFFVVVAIDRSGKSGQEEEEEERERNMFGLGSRTRSDT